jgi:hypothetical protein
MPVDSKYGFTLSYKAYRIFWGLNSSGLVDAPWFDKQYPLFYGFPFIGGFVRAAQEREY